MIGIVVKSLKIVANFIVENIKALFVKNLHYYLEKVNGNDILYVIGVEEIGVVNVPFKKDEKNEKENREIAENSLVMNKI